MLSLFLSFFKSLKSLLNIMNNKQILKNVAIVKTSLNRIHLLFLSTGQLIWFM